MKTNEIVLGILLKGAPGNDDYVAAIEHVPAIAELAAGILLGRNPTNGELLRIIAKVPNCRRKAWGKLLEQQPANDEVVWIVKEVHELRDEAWEQLLKQSPANSDLVCIINGVRALEVVAWQLLTQRSVTEAELLAIYGRHCELKESPLRAQVASMLTRLDYQKETLMRIILNEDALREMATRLFLQKAPSREELCSLLVWVKTPVINEEICKLLMEGESSLNDLCAVASLGSDSAMGDEAAEKLLAQQFENDSDEDLACRAVFYRPAFVRRALDRILTVIDRRTRGEKQYVYDLQSLHGYMDRFEGLNALRVEVARKFLIATKDDKEWERAIKAVLGAHPELRQ